MTRRQQREHLIQVLEQGTWAERVWLPLVRLIHRLAYNADQRYEERKNRC